MVNKKLKLETIAKNFYSSINVAEDHVIKDKDAFHDIWDRTYNPINQPSLPSVDFAKEMVLASYLEMKSAGGWRIEIQEAIETNKTIEVIVRESSPKTPSASMMSNPYHMVKLEKSEKPVKFTRKSS